MTLSSWNAQRVDLIIVCMLVYTLYIHQTINVAVVEWWWCFCICLCHRHCCRHRIYCVLSICIFFLSSINVHSKHTDRHRTNVQMFVRARRFTRLRFTWNDYFWTCDKRTWLNCFYLYFCRRNKIKTHPGLGCEQIHRNKLRDPKPIYIKTHIRIHTEIETETDKQTHAQINANAQSGSAYVSVEWISVWFSCVSIYWLWLSFVLWSLKCV